MRSGRKRTGIKEGLNNRRAPAIRGFGGGGCLARLIGGSIAIGKTEDEKQLEQNAGRLRVLKRQLAGTDYIAVKIADGAAAAQEYAAKIAERQAWRTEIGLLEKALQTA